MIPTLPYFMKTNLRLLLPLLAATSLVAAPLTSTTAVHTRPDSSAPTVTVLTAGSEPTPAVGLALPLPSGWQAIELAGPHEVYLHGKDLTKNLDIKAGSEFRTAPKADAPVFATFTAGDKAEITGLRGKWTQFKLEKKIVGYIQTGSPVSGTASSATAPRASAEVATRSTPTAMPPPAPSPVPATASAGGPSGRPAQMINLGDGGSSALPRLFKGQLVASRRSLIARKPYEFQLNDDGGARYAYIDTSKLLLTEQIEKYVDHTVVVYGTAKPVPNSKDIVIQVESLQLP